MNVAFSFDWDFFYDENKQDWGHREAPFFIETIWEIRAQDFALRGENYLDYHASGVTELLQRLQRLAIKIPALYVSESHLYAYQLFTNLVHADLLINFDTHSDMASAPHEAEYVDCGSWLYELLLHRPKMKALWVLPAHSFPVHEKDALHALRGLLPNFASLRASFFDVWWQNEFRKRKPNVVMAFACRSGAWTPPWDDVAFQNFIDALTPTQLWHENKRLEPRRFNPPTEENIAQMKQLIANLNKRREEPRE